MYSKNKNNRFNIRLSDIDYDFLVCLSRTRNCSVSDVTRQIIGEYRRRLLDDKSAHINHKL